MLRTYIKFAWRHLRKSFSYSFINITGLAIGIGAVLLIFLYIQHELSFDEYHEKKERIYRITSYAGFNEKSWRGNSLGDPIPELRTSYASVEEGARMINCGVGTITVDDEEFTGLKQYCAESNLFNIFSFPLVAGSPESALDAPFTAVLSRSTADKMFGDENPVGQSFQMRYDGEERSFEVTGVMEDIPVNTHFRYDLFISYSTEETTSRCMDCGSQSQYLLLKEGADTEAIADQILQHVRNIDGKEYVEDIELQPLEDIHFGSLYAPRKGDLQYIQILSAIAIVILIIACGNYMNMATARHSKRSREIGIRKVMGAYRTQLIRQFLFETLFLTIIALPFALILLKGAIPWFNIYADTEISLSLADNILFYIAIIGVLGLAGLAAGSYPAFFVSGFMPQEVLQGNRRMGLGAAGVRKGLVTFQFLVTLVMIGITVVILQQLSYVQTKNLGFDTDQIVTIDINDPALRTQGDAVKQEFLRMASVESATASPAPSAGRFARVSLTFQKDTTTDQKYTFKTPRIDADFIETFDIDLLAGRNISPTFDKEDRFPQDALINETGVEVLGYDSHNDILGETIARRYRVVGVVEDFHLESLQNEIEPAVMGLSQFNTTFTINVRLAGGSVQQGLEDLRAAWENTGATTPLDYSFLDDKLQQQYEQEQQTASVIGFFAGLSILIAGMGLFGLAAFTTEQRKKEIGIRKVVGAGVKDIVLLLYKDFGKLIALSAVLSVPIIYIAAGRWLENFAYRIEIGPAVFVIAILAVSLVTILSTGVRSLRAALMNPAETIRSE